MTSAERRLVMAWHDYCVTPCLLSRVLLRAAWGVVAMERAL